ncbi:hypothetical protein [Mucilaginibacter paludis]|uniref:Uncharacterized protein n=1 Tax=Mucilaginibacter paludis DSM 18603 TaxID=714943 RepID=H1Y1S0_9SPHI|nr:hypothetical protein [Mucilaginibacter paludis]EHQ24729.1 hypothetical protein Mucpa_0537 [Mucilaginibacter paludis DSM 18603]
MSLQYISDNEGNHTAVLIPIDEWELLTSKYRDLKLMEKPKVVNHSKLSDFAGTLPKDVAEQMQEYIKQSRDEWR